MTGCKPCSLGAASLALAATAALVVPSPVSSASPVSPALAEAKLLNTESWIMGGSGLPIPPPSYLTDVSERYINPSAFPDFSNPGSSTGQPLFVGQPEFPVDKTNPLFTPEGLYPFEGVKELEFNPSVAQGLSILNTTITNQVATHTPTVVFGYSQSATISTLEMQKLLAEPEAEQPTGDQLKFVLIGDPNNPDGGALSRFDFPGMQPLTIASLGITFSGATPSETPWDTAIYTQEYDGFADFPKYPLNLLADINAVLGIAFIHGTYPTITAEQISKAIQLPTSDDYTGDLANTQYFMIPTEDLPLLDILRKVPVLGNPLADLLQPDLKVLVNLGYGNIENGWDPGPANEATPFGLFPQVNLGDVLSALGAGAKQGVQDFAHDLSHPALSSLPAGGADTPDLASLNLTDIVNGFSSALASAYSALLPTVDIANALTTTMPAYDVSLLTHFLGEGNIADALLMPIGVDFALTSIAGGFELRVIQNTIEGIAGAFSGAS